MEKTDGYFDRLKIENVTTAGISKLETEYVPKDVYMSLLDTHAAIVSDLNTELRESRKAQLNAITTVLEARHEYDVKCDQYEAALDDERKNSSEIYAKYLRTDRDRVTFARMYRWHMRVNIGLIVFIMTSLIILISSGVISLSKTPSPIETPMSSAPAILRQEMEIVSSSQYETPGR